MPEIIKHADDEAANADAVTHRTVVELNDRDNMLLQEFTLAKSKSKSAILRECLRYCHKKEFGK
jgi:hypothetical protein